ncbi:MAG: hypothetical protein IJB51_06875, partial [Clostridia bacterium]|nr:hypothetical protein [Clostridia bacterium]
ICRNQLHSRAFVYLNMPQILLDTLKGNKRDIYKYGAFDTESFDALYRSFFQNLRSYIRALAEAFAPFESIHHQIKLEPIQSAFTADCMARGLDICQGGARYQHKTLSLVGFGTLVDSLLALEEAYREGRLSELMAALEADFQGYEVLRAKLQNSKNRFGHSQSADAYAKKLAEDLSKVSRGIYNGQGIEWHTSLFTYYFFHTWRNTPATPDGRRQGEDLSRQMNMARLPELTTAAESLAAITEAEFDDVGMLDIAIPFGEGDRYLTVMADYIKTCIDLKIPVLQPNVVDKKLLVEERDHKGTHPDLVVRICGYSALFGVLSRDMQDEVINRTEY